MKKVIFVLIVLSMFFLFPFVSFSQDSEKTIGPVTITQSVFTIDYPQESISVILSAPPSDETHDIYIFINAVGWLDGENLHKLNGGETKEVIVTIHWAYVYPGETRQEYIKIRVYPDEKTQDKIIDEQALSITGIKPSALNQKNLSVIRDGFPTIEVYFQQVSPVEGNSMLNRRDAEFYFDTGAVVEINASRPIPTPCIGCPQIEFAGIIGAERVQWPDNVFQITMDADKEITVIYELREGNPTSSPTPGPTGGEKGDVNEDGSIDIVDALLVAQHYVGLPVTINTDSADADCSGSIDIIDALLIAQFYVGLISGFCL